MSFFEPPPPPPERQPPGRPAPWSAPPENEIGASVPLRLLLARTSELAVALVDAIAYSTGFTFRLAVRLHPEADQLDGRELMHQLHGLPRGSGEDRLRFGIEFSDGRKATNLGSFRPPAEEPEINLRSQGGGGGGGRHWQTGYWIYPIPPPGPITVAIAWPAHGIAEQTTSLDSAPIIEAASMSLVLWEDNRPIRSSNAPPAESGGSQTVLD